MLWDPFLMKKLLKSEICGFVNSARIHCSRTKSQQVRLPKKKNAETRWKQNVDAISRIQTSPNSLLNFQLFLQYSLSLSIISLSLWVSLINMGMYKSSKQRLQFRIYLDYKLGISHSLLLPKKSGWK